MSVMDVTQPEPRPARKMSLIFAVNDLRAVVDRMIKPATSYINNQYIEIPGLYQQIVDALAGEQGAGTSGIAKSRPPFWTDAAEKKFEFDLIVEFNLPNYTGARTIAARLWALAQHQWAVEQVHDVHRITGILKAWADDFDALLNNRHVLHIAAACPACGTATVNRYSKSGELVRDTAIIATEFGAVCQECGYSWGPEQFVKLAKQLGSLPKGVLE